MKLHRETLNRRLRARDTRRRMEAMRQNSIGLRREVFAALDAPKLPELPYLGYGADLAEVLAQMTPDEIERATARILRDLGATDGDLGATDGDLADLDAGLPVSAETVRIARRFNER